MILFWKDVEQKNSWRPGPEHLWTRAQTRKRICRIFYWFVSLLKFLSSLIFICDSVEAKWNRVMCRNWKSSKLSFSNKASIDSLLLRTVAQLGVDAWIYGAHLKLLFSALHVSFYFNYSMHDKLTMCSEVRYELFQFLHDFVLDSY